MTRSDVAKHLGKSISTVRRLEGVELFPRVDSRGVHHFDEWAVRSLHERMLEGLQLPNGMSEPTLPSPKHASPNESSRVRKLAKDVKALKREVRAMGEVIELICKG